MAELKLDLHVFGEAREAEKKKIEKKKKAVQNAQKKRRINNETMEEAWNRIFKMKNTDSDLKKLQAVKEAMDSGKIGRLPESLQKGRLFSKAEALRLYTALKELQREELLKSLVKTKPKNYLLINKADIFKKVVNDLNNESIIAVDTETTGVNPFVDKIVGFNFTLPRANYHVYIPIRHTEGEQLPVELVVSTLKPVLENENIKKVLHNAKFDIHMMKLSEGVELRGLEWDTMVAMHVLNENETSFKLKDLVTRYLKEPADNYEELFGKSGFENIPLDIATVYACKDTDLTWRLYQFQLKHFKRLPQLLDVLEKVEIPIINVTVEMEQAGFVFDHAKAEEVRGELGNEIREIESKLRELLGDINFNSPAQLSKVLFGKLKLNKYLPPDMKVSTDVKTLGLLKKRHESIPLLIRYRELTKLLYTYVNALPEQVQQDGRVHGSFNQMGTVTGRFSSNNPNLQNQPKYARKLFIAPEGSVILSADFSQQEPRLLAHFSEEPALLEAYRNGLDLYSYMASKVYKIPYEQCVDGTIYRKRMKTGVLAVMYGTGASTLADQMGVSVEDAKQFIDDFYKTFPRVRAWVEHNKRMARERGYVTMFLGRKRRLPDAKNTDSWVRARAERQATNARIQGSAAIQTKLTMLALWKWCQQKRKQGREFRMLATVHDEVLLYAPEDVTIEEVVEFENIMLNTVKLKVPNKTDIEVQKRWGEGVVFDSKKKAWIPSVDGIELGMYTDARIAIEVLENALASSKKDTV